MSEPICWVDAVGDANKVGAQRNGKLIYQCIQTACLRMLPPLRAASRGWGCWLSRQWLQCPLAAGRDGVPRWHLQRRYMGC